MLKLNGYWYSYAEVREALEKKGYAVIHEETEPDKHGDTKNIWTAIKDGKTHSLEDAAFNEFHKKPPLI